MKLLPTSTRNDDAVDEPVPVRLVPSAQFTYGTEEVPPGIRAREIDTMVQGIVEDRSPFPIEQTAWGFLLDNRTRQETHVLHYAGARELVFGSAAEAKDVSSGPVFPGIVATTGLSFGGTTWLVLREKECLSAVCFHPRSTIPSRVVSRFIEPDCGEDALWRARTQLLEDCTIEDDAETLAGFVRMETAQQTGEKQIVFHLSRQKEPEQDFHIWRKTRLARPYRILAADTRERGALSAGQRTRTSRKRVLRVAAAFALATAALALLELYLGYRRNSAEKLLEQAEARQEEVAHLRQLKEMAVSLSDYGTGDFSPFLWLMVANEARPEAVAYRAVEIDSSGQMRIAGQAEEASALNTYVEALSNDPRFAEVSMDGITTSAEGISFQLRLKTGSLDALSAEQTADRGPQNPEAEDNPS